VAPCRGDLGRRTARPGSSTPPTRLPPTWPWARTSTSPWTERRVTATITGTVYAPGGIHGALLTSWPTLSGAAGLAVNQYVVALRPGITPPAYAAALGHSYTVDTIQPGQSGSVGLYGDVDTPLIQLLTLLVAVLAGLAFAVIGALRPATWAAMSRTTTALHAE
jgi:hypothetical protein